MKNKAESKVWGPCTVVIGSWGQSCRVRFLVLQDVAFIRHIGAVTRDRTRGTHDGRDQEFKTDIFVSHGDMSPAFAFSNG